MAAKAKYAAKRAAASKKLASATVALVQHDPSRPPPLSLKDQTIFKEILVCLSFCLSSSAHTFPTHLSPLCSINTNISNTLPP